MDEGKNEASYLTYRMDKDLESLWKAIVVTHGIKSVSKELAVMKQVAWDAYRRCKQGGFERLINYRENFDALHKSFETQGNITIQPKDVTMPFLAD